MTSAVQIDNRLEAEVRAAHARGWVLTPLTGKKPTRREWQKEPPLSLDRLTDWARHDNVGVRTGRISGIVVVDLDEGGDVSELDLPRTWTVETGGGGRHFYFSLPDGVGIKNSAGKLGDHIDVRGDGGQVVMPGSVHPETEEVYRWKAGCSPNDIPIAEFPAHLLKRLQPPKPVTPPSDPRNGNGRNVGPYVKAALENELKAIESAPEGQRNDTVNRAAFNLAGLVHTCEISEQAIEQALLPAALATSLTEHEARATIASGIKAGLASPREIPETKPPAKRRVAAPASALDKVKLDDEPEFTRTELCTDKAAAQLFVDQSGGSCRYVPEWGWLVWDGRRWKRDAEGRVKTMALEVGGRYRDKALDMHAKRAPDKMVKWLLSHARRCESSRGVNDFLTLAQAGLHEPVERFDTLPFLVNARNCTLDFSQIDGALVPAHEHSSDDMLTRVIPCDWHKGAPRPLWDRFLCDIFPDEDVRAFVQRAAGYSLLGTTRAQCFFILWGKGSNGKSTYLNTLQAILGQDYAAQAPQRLLMVKQGDQARFDMARLKGIRFLSAIETGDSNRLDEALIKSLTGGDPISAEFKYRDPFQFTPQFKLWLATNHRPQIRGTDHAMWRRVRLIPFTETIPDEQQDLDLDVKLLEEAEGILDWAVDGAIAFLREGLAPPSSIDAATNEYRSKEDVLGQFLEECTEPGRAAEVGKTELHAAYRDWCERQDEYALKQRGFSGFVADRGFDSHRGTGNKHYWIGLRLRTGQ